jgi:hypothetical protein
MELLQTHSPVLPSLVSHKLVWWTARPPYHLQETASQAQIPVRHQLLQVSPTTERVAQLVVDPVADLAVCQPVTRDHRPASRVEDQAAPPAAALEAMASQARARGKASRVVLRGRDTTDFLSAFLCLDVNMCS